LLSERDLPGCVALSAEAGWNQTADDWTLFMRRGTVLGVPDSGGHPVASGAILPYPNGFAWISMVLVTAPRRRERIGTGILETCCAEIAGKNFVAMLDATPAGERVYRPLGFEPVLNLTRWQGEGGDSISAPAGTRAMSAADIATVTEIDATAFGAERRFLLESLHNRAPQLAHVTEPKITGFVLARPGRIATQIGPVVASDEEEAALLLRAALDAVRGPVFLDVADRWAELRGNLQARGFTVQRPFLRMGLKRSAPFGDPSRLFVVAGPEFG